MEGSSMFFSKKANYGIQALIFLYKFKHKKKYFKSKEIAETLDIKTSYLTKILQDLVRKGILSSSTGPEGGFCFPTENENIDLLQIYSFLEKRELLSECAMGWKPCNENNPCPLHEQWNSFKIELLNTLKNTTIKEASTIFWPQLEY